MVLAPPPVPAPGPLGTHRLCARAGTQQKTFLPQSGSNVQKEQIGRRVRVPQEKSTSGMQLPNKPSHLCVLRVAKTAAQEKADPVDGPCLAGDQGEWAPG